ncbi:hypothetical protein P152DRAFT_471873 [Eremomyces bilateralis CBS 781.70]|uniref:BRCT domain-containing protein n=1 Tax=Eremomyces bilateralis CBS 781.70 TaxID=1392243 RepID=A0A6G1GAZ4_9PEZI|nr:uncharacterized protein P152DRAFT_471873 [Eremomyces bilateralis CBS 781.70]KAF1815258.1 hypothetical protein P152DRAFT_471873 [Eremomyces bilateralis CBS 781.70]
MEAEGDHVTDGLTHLICSKYHFKRKTVLVASALKWKKKIVSYDWLEDSLLRHSKQREGTYQRTNNRIEGTETSEGSEVTEGRRPIPLEKRFNDGIKDAKRDLVSSTSESLSSSPTSAVESLARARQMRALVEGKPSPRKRSKADGWRAAPDNHHIYQDASGFSFYCCLVNSDVTTNETEKSTNPTSYHTLPSDFPSQDATGVGEALGRAGGNQGVDPVADERAGGGGGVSGVVVCSAEGGEPRGMELGIVERKVEVRDESEMPDVSDVEVVRALSLKSDTPSSLDLPF